MRNRNIKLCFLLSVSLCMMFACAMPPLEHTSTVEPTQPITNTALILPTATAPLSTSTVIIISATATVALTDTATLTPTIPYTPTSSIPMVTVWVGTNCREGPGIIYNLLDGLMVGEQAEIVKLAPAGVDYVVIKQPHGFGECWLWLEYAVITGDTSQLPIATIPPTPTATSTSTPSPTETPAVPSFFAGDWTMTVDRRSVGVTVTQEGNTIRGTFELSSGSQVTFNGTLSPDGKIATGTISQSAGTGTFVWFLLDTQTQFNGHGVTGRMFPWCGYRAGQSTPTPCLAQ